jgi:hypothetical protein
MTGLGRRVAVAALFTGLTVAAWAAWAKDDQPGGDKKSEEKGAEKGALPRMQYQHTTRSNNPGIFKLEGNKGSAEYVFNNQRRKDDLVFVRTGTVDGQDGWVYQVERSGKKQPLWFFFASKPIKNAKGEDVYPMYYSVQPDDSNRKKPWIRILTPTGTKGTKLDSKPDKKDEQ